ncbi:BTB/POZ and TAZ domain-containing protein 1 [Ricinus communis]|uniref:Protein binding protein, putative n=1 Tax=Ricinus communis TaxID=3988 RepID=B9RAQ1_RICCO|nr:BTB/POZ and TAZ domain-containing protein 1 [Ricinus communis]EEF51878.1 protein binding protein, putative [Ricinus communis]|eukprot:XP_002511276.1 BTB/POZ and TAZ domain-containing protein 1 [Ricinus communis]
MEEAHSTTATSTLYGDLYAHFQNIDGNSRELPEPDVQILTSGGLRIPVHSSILASVSSVLENIIDRPRKHRSSERIIPILGVPCDAVSVFVRFIYSARCTEDELEKFGIHLLALSHVYLVPQLKQRCAKDVGQRLTVDNVVDVLQLARLCDAPDLYLKCMKLITNHFKSVEKTEGWEFMQNHDPFLEYEILQFIDEAELRKKRTRRHRQEQSLYMELGVAMDCLEHICTEGCTSVGPYDVQPTKKRVPCNKFSTCQGLQLLIKHFATCKNRVNGGCSRCKRMWQLLRLHASMCDQPDSCRVPLCRQFKLKMQHEKKGDDALWKLLVRKVVSARVLSSLSLPKRKREEQLKETIHDHGIRTFRL